MPLAGKRAVVSGSTGALGEVIVQRFLREGLKVVGSYRDPKDVEERSDPARPNFLRVRADVTVETEVRTLFETAVRTMGGIDIFVHTVGGFLPKKVLTDVSSEEWDRMLNMNLKSAFLCTREALRTMKGQPYGRIVLLSAMTGLFPSPGRAPYAISKAGVSLLTDIVGQEQKGSGITVNAIAPSIIDTAPNRASMPNEDHRQWVKPEHIADVICYLCSDAAKDITGTTLKAFGGV